MFYNTNFEIAGLIIIFFVLFDFFRTKKFSRESTKMLCTLIVFSVIASVLGIVANNLSSVWNNKTFLQLVSCTYFVLHAMSLYFTFLFLVTIHDRIRKSPIVLQIFAIIPVLASFVVCTLTCLNVLPYDYSLSEYVSLTPLAITNMSIVGFNLVIFLTILIIYRKKLNKSEKIIIHLINIIHAAATIINLFFPQILLFAFACDCSAGLMYLFLERPSEYLDSETGLLNKKALVSYLENKTNGKKPFSLIEIKLTNFHLANEMFSYENQNKLIIEIAKAFNTNKRKRKLFQYDMNSIVISEKDNDQNLTVEDIQARFNKPWSIDGASVRLTANIIKETYPNDFTSADYGLDLMLYLSEQLKKQTLNGTITASEEYIASHKQSKLFEIAIQKAIENKSFKVYYQPIHNAQNGKLCSAEALVRLFDDKLGFVPPSEFIPIAERNGSIVEIGEQIFEQCCVFIKKYVQTKKVDIEFLEINLSAVQCMQPDLADKFIAIMQKHEVDPKLVNLELTETAITNNEDLVQEHMKKLKETGITFSCDDYGTGYSTCSYLLKFPFSQVKFDKTMIDAHFESKNAKVIVSNEIKTLKSLGFSIVAEGVETAKQLATLIVENVDHIQGYYFSKPLPENEFVIYGTVSSFNHLNNLKKAIQKPKKVTETTKATAKIASTEKQQVKSSAKTEVSTAKTQTKPLKKTTSSSN